MRVGRLRPATRPCRHRVCRSSDQHKVLHGGNRIIESNDDSHGLLFLRRDRRRGVAQLFPSPRESSTSRAGVYDLPGRSPGWPRLSMKNHLRFQLPKPARLVCKAARWNSSGGRIRCAPARFFAPVSARMDSMVHPEIFVDVAAARSSFSLRQVEPQYAVAHQSRTRHQHGQNFLISQPREVHMLQRIFSSAGRRR